MACTLDSSSVAARKRTRTIAGLLLGAGAMASTTVWAAEKVTPDNYVEAEVDVTFAQIVRDVGSNKFRHDCSLIPLDKQPAVTMNRDTIY